MVTGAPYRTADALADPAAQPDYGRQFILAEGVKTAMVVPIRTDERLEGVINVARRTPSPFTDEDERASLRLADHAAIALRNARLYRAEAAARADAEAVARRFRLLAEASAVLASSPDYDGTIAAVLELALPALGDWAEVYLARADGSFRRIGPVCLDPERAAVARAIADAAPLAKWLGLDDAVFQAQLRGEPVVVPELSSAWLAEHLSGADYLALIQGAQPKSLLLVPLVARGRTIGSMMFVTTRALREYEDADIALARDLGRRAGLAVDNARLYRRAERARTDAETANRAKDEFLAILSHELRTPLTAILGWTSLASGGWLDDAQMRRALETIDRNARLQTTLIDDLLDVSRIISGKLAIERAAVNLITTIAAALESVRTLAAAKGVEIVQTIDPGVGFVLGDTARLQQVVWNLLSNAIKFTPRGGRVELRLDASGGAARLTVSDTGQGIHPDFLPHVFDRFRQGQTGTASAYAGLGLGLAIVRYLVESHGGSVEAASPGEGQGATFTVTLPLSAATPDLTSAAGERVRGDIRTDLLGGVRILIVEDEEDARSYVATVLSEIGGDVRAVGSADDALRMAEEFTPDVLLANIRMQGKDGYTLLRDLRARGIAAPAIAVTAYAARQDVHRAIATGFQAHLAKPVTPEQLIATVARLAGREPLRAAS
jgi:signal transduction histidine kinase